MSWAHVDELRPNPRNPRVHGPEVHALARTIVRTAWGAPIVAQRRTKRIIGGHGRLEAAKEILAGIEIDGELRGGADYLFDPDAPGPGYVPVRWVDVNDATADAMTLADNSTAIQGKDDLASLQAMASGVAESIRLDLGVDQERLNARIEAAADAILDGDRASSASSESHEDDEDRDSQDERSTSEALDRAAELQRKWGTEQGQLWLIQSPSGLEHRLLCGDCRDEQDVRRLVGSDKVAVAFTSPPYASQRKYDEESGFKPIRPDEYVDWFEPVQRNVRAVLAGDGSWFVNIKAHVESGQRSLYVFDLVVAHARQWGWKFVDDFVWNHQGLPGHWPDRFKNQHEPVFHFSSGTPAARHANVMVESDESFTYADMKRGAATSTGNIGWKGGEIETRSGLARPGNVVQVKNSSADRAGVAHSAAFPVALPEFFIKAFSDDGDVIFDPFLGSGTTIVAADRNGRVGIGTELSPKYVAVCLERFESLGMRPRLAQ